MFCLYRFPLTGILLILIAGCIYGQNADTITSSAGNKNRKHDTLFRIKSPLNKDCQQEQLGDIFKKKKDRSERPPKRFAAIVLPEISSTPSTGFLLGVTSSLAWYSGNPMNTKVSSSGASADVTSKNQFLLTLRSTVYTRENKYFLQGDWRFYLYSQPTYGLGTNAPDTVQPPTGFGYNASDTREKDGSFPMRYHYIKFYEIVSRQIYRQFYAGLGYHLLNHYNISNQLLKTDTIPQQLTPHYNYCVMHDFDTLRYTTSGISFNFVYDSRDNLINPYEGMYMTANYLYNFRFLGSSQQSSLLWLEFRTYKSLSKKKPRNLIAFWLFGNFVTSGNAPYLNLPAIGYDPQNRSGRGYPQGRFRGEDLVYGEIEYRFPISPCSQIIGGVVFANLTTTSDRDRNIGLFKFIRPGYGAGLRIMIDKYVRTNILIDFGFGHKSGGLFLQAQEAF